MKKTMMLALAGTAFLMASCNKDYKCYCNDQLNDKDTVLIRPVKERSVKKANVSCENMSDSNGECSLNH